MADTGSCELITISVARLKELEDLERNLKERVEEAISNNKKEALKRLHEKDKANPAAVKERIKRYNQKNRDKINEKRREKRKNIQEQGVEQLNTSPEATATPSPLPVSTNNTVILSFDG